MNPEVYLIPTGVVVLIAFVVLIWLALRRARNFRLDLSDYEGLTQLNRATAISRWAAIAVGLAIMMICVLNGRWDIGLFVAPIIIACAIQAGMVISQVADRRAAQFGGVAGLERRHAKHYFAKSFVPTAVATFLMGVLTVTWLAFATSYGGGGRHGSFMLIARAGNNTTTVATICDETRLYLDMNAAQTVIVVWLLTVILTVAAVATIVDRPRNGADQVLSDLDDALRRRSIKTTIATLLGGTTGCLAMTALWTIPAQVLAYTAVYRNSAAACLTQPLPTIASPDDYPGWDYSNLGPWHFDQATHALANPAVLAGLIIVVAGAFAIALVSVSTVVSGGALAPEHRRDTESGQSTDLDDPTAEDTTDVQDTAASATHGVTSDAPGDTAALPSTSAPEVTS